jgi:ferric-dicitrate binding protein FerR (iron transport regulator)
VECTDNHNKNGFIHDPDFIEWVLNPTSDSDQYWHAWLAENPSQEKEVESAKFLIKNLTHETKSITDEEVLTLWNKIEHTKTIRTKKLFRLKSWSVVAGILMIIGISGWMTSQKTSKKIDYKSIAAVPVVGNDIKLILSDQTEKTFASKEVELKYNPEGQLETKAGKQVQKEELNRGTVAEQMNQLVVPFGKRSSVELADGTRLWLNSGSRAIYPVAFNGKTREIYIEGEGYLEVAHLAQKPFVVVTDRVKVKVLGTKFNISAYKDDEYVSVVLVEGSVQASTQEENIIMKPDQLLKCGKDSQKSTLEKVNVHEHVSWVDGWMMCNKESIRSVITKLSRYYNLKINYNDPRLNSMTLTGKLDLKNNFEDVLEVICATAPIKYETVDKTTYLRIRE